MKKLLIILFLALIASLPAYAANTVVTENQTVQITPDGSTDFTSAEITGAPASGIVTVYSIQFNPSAANDILIMHNNTINGTDLFNSGPAGSTAPIIKYYPDGKKAKIVMDASDCTFGTAANARIYIELK